MMSKKPQQSLSSHSEVTRRTFLKSAGIVGIGLALSPTDAFSAALPSATHLDNAIVPAARPLPLSAVRLTDGPLKHAQDLDRAYLLKLDSDRMMAYFRVRAGLKPLEKGYDGWDGDGRALTGHIAGHYLSAVSLMYAATGDKRFQDRANYLVSEMQHVQDADGYLGALEHGKEHFAEVAKGDIRSGGFDLNGLWSPWYVEHKLFAGLRDAYRYTKNQTALAIETKFAGWVESIVGALTDTQDQKMLATEFGGMNEVLVDLYADTNNKRWLALADKFEHQSVIEPLTQHQDKLGGLHANTQVPKAIGTLARYVSTGRASDGIAATFFWDAVVNHHSFATGGHGKDEYFGPPDELSERLDGRTDESCNVYNMLKLTRELFALNPDVKYAEYHERALFNHILGSIDPQDGSMCYMVPVGRGVQREYQDMFHDFTCCVGSGMESHALHGYGIYYEADHKLWINLYVPTQVDWKSVGAHLTMHTNFPEGEAAFLKITLDQSKKLTLALRRPAWAGDGFQVLVNGKAVTHLTETGSYCEVTRLWKTGDTVAIALPKALHIEPVPDNPKRVALLWGPLVLAGDLGPETSKANTPTPFPALVTDSQPLTHWLRPITGQAGAFESVDAGRDLNTGASQEYRLVPFYRLHRRTYAAYWDLFTKSEWNEKASELAAEQEKRRALEAATVGYAQPGEMQSERDFHQQGEDTSPDMLLGRHSRRGRKWFSFEMPIDSAYPMQLSVTYCTQEFGKRLFDIFADDVIIGHQTIERSHPGSSTARFYDVAYEIPATVIANHQKVTIKFVAAGGSEIAAVYGIRTIRVGSAAK